MHYCMKEIIDAPNLVESHLTNHTDDSIIRYFNDKMFSSMISTKHDSSLINNDSHLEHAEVAETLENVCADSINNQVAEGLVRPFRAREIE